MSLEILHSSHQSLELLELISKSRTTTEKFMCSPNHLKQAKLRGFLNMLHYLQTTAPILCVHVFIVHSICMYIEVKHHAVSEQELSCSVHLAPPTSSTSPWSQTTPLERPNMLRTIGWSLKRRTTVTSMKTSHSYTYSKFKLTRSARANLCAHAHAFIFRARETSLLHGNSFVCHPLPSRVQEVTKR